MRTLFEQATLGRLTLNNHMVMAPMTRCRATGNVPNELMAEYYAQRSTAGLIITEGTSPSPNGLGYARIPGVFATQQIDGWRGIADAVHQAGGKIFMQLMHCGRIAHPLNLPAGARMLAPSAIAAPGTMYTDDEGLQPHPAPSAMSSDDIEQAIEEFATAAHNAIAAGLDGIEIHGANGYLLEQFLRPNTNRRDDAYGGPIERRARFVLDVVDAVVGATGGDRVGIRLSPFGNFNDMPIYDEMAADYTYLAERLNETDIAYVHLVDHSAMGAPPVPDSIKSTFRERFRRTLILSGGYDVTRAEHDLETGRADLIAIGRAFIANPDLVARWRAGAQENAPDMDTFYTPGPVGYTDYPMRSA
ncbi:MAG: alkene reductase [Chromatiaceae bacterium]|nr:alkene reductase [Chromatiaceae bacterium]MCP5315501.1 alkene reductase [Chromatiaceae bacterium]